MKLGDYLSDSVSKWLGTWWFVSALSFFTAVWIGWNVNAPKNKRFDPFPFVALNLCYSFLAGYTAPILLMSSSRQGRLDRERMIENLELERQDNKHLHAMLHRIITLEEDIENAMKLRTSPIPAQPQWVCHVCGEMFGTWWEAGQYWGPTKHCATYHVDDCQVCGKHVPCTEPRDFGYLRKEWIEFAEKNIPSKPQADQREISSQSMEA